MLQRSALIASTVALLAMTASVLALSIALVSGHNFDAPPSLPLAIAAAVTLLLLPGLAYSMNRGIAILAIVIVAAAAAALAIYFEAWVASCPTCSAGDMSRANALKGAWLWFGILGALAAGITLIGAGISAAASLMLKRRSVLS